MLPTHIRLMRHSHMCAPMNDLIPTANTLPSQSSPQKSAGSKSQLRSKQSSNEPSQENFLTIGGYFEHYKYMYRITVLGWPKKEERKKDEQI